MKLRSAHRRNPIVSRKTPQFRVDNPRIAPRNGDNYVDPRASVCMYAGMAAITEQTTGGGESKSWKLKRDGEREGENIRTSMSLPYHVTNVGQFTNPIISNANDDAAVYGLLRQYAFKRRGSRRAR